MFSSKCTTIVQILKAESWIEVAISLKAPCYLCGEESVLDGLCGSCYAKEHPLAEVPPMVSIETCKRCGAIKVPGGWKRIPTSISEDEEVLEFQLWDLLGREVKTASSDVEISLEELNRLDRVLHMKLHLEGKSHPFLPEHTEAYDIEIRRSFSTCDTCGMMSGGYHEAILQIRADGRKLTEREESEITKIVADMTVSDYEADAKAFVTSMSTDQYGMDFYVGSEHLTRSLATELESRYLAERKENFKLIGQDKGGKDKFRVTILVRLPRFTIGDFVSVAQNPCQVMAMSRGGLTCFDLRTRTQFTMNQKSVKWRSLEFLAEESEKRPFMIVTHAFGQPVQLMDTKSYETIEVEATDLDFEFSTGETVYGVELGDEFYILPRSPVS